MLTIGVFRRKRARCAYLMVRLTVVLPTSSRGASQLVEAIRSLMIGIRSQDGCIDCSVWLDSDSSVHYFEEWATEEDIRRRIQSFSFTSLLNVMEAAREPPQIRFEFLNRVRGLDYVAEVRQEPNV